MSTWQDIFKVKIKEMHVTDPWTLLEDDTLQVQGCKPGWKEFVQHRALGRFECSQCFHKWSSAKVYILFHMCLCQGCGTVQMQVFRQECRRCPKPRLEDPDFSLETVETILHNLVIKILQYFYKEPVQPSDLLEVVVDKPVTGPHDSAHCEACRLGICNKSRLAPALDAWKPLMDEDEARMHSTNSWLAWTPGVWKPLSDVSKARTYSPKPESSLKSSLRSDDCEPLIGVGKARAHRTKPQPAPAWADWRAEVPRTFQTRTRRDLRPHAASTHPSSPSNSNFPWKRCCCIGSTLLCVLAVIIFVVLYLTMRGGPGHHKEDHREDHKEDLGQWLGKMTEGLENWLPKSALALGSVRLPQLQVPW